MIVSKFLRGGFSQIKQHLRWRQYGQLLQFFVYEPNNMETIIYPVDDLLTFQQLKQRQLFKQYLFILPKDFDTSIPIYTILTKHQKSVSIEVDYRGQKYNLLNRVAQSDQRCLLKALSSQSGLLKIASTQCHISHFRRFMNGFYLRLQAESYIKRKTLNSKQEMANSFKQQVISYLASTNQVQQQSIISNYMQIQEAVTLKILKTQQKVNQILQKADNFLQIYRAGAIAISLAHIGGFGYMIFFVDWLGWDIIEPLTFSVGSFYSLLGLRFYRKFNKDRNQQSILYTLQGWVLNAQKRIELKQLRSKLQQQKRELRDIENKIRIAHNRLTLQSNLPIDF